MVQRIESIKKLHKLEINTCFCDSYASWQKDGVENANKVIRRYIPKSSNISDYSHQYVMDIYIDLKSFLPGGNIHLMDTLIAYKTRNGASKKYADWLAERYKSEAKDFDMIDEKDFKKAKKIFIISGTYGGIMPLTDFTRTNWNYIKNKDITLVAVGMAPEKSWWSKLSFFMIPGSIKKRVKYYKLPGQMPDTPKTDDNVKRENLKRVK